ncbi:MAG: hypothetical protein NT159_25190, partial [Proteobacteria bacterium]|nr:hypothetical protein [Pseudomonadota bacterium]
LYPLHRQFSEFRRVFLLRYLLQLRFSFQFTGALYPISWKTKFRGKLSTPFCYSPGRSNQDHAVSYQEMIGLMTKIFPFLAILSLIDLAINFLVFPIANDLLVRNFLSSLSMVVPFCLLALGMLWGRIEPHWAVLGVFVLLAALFLSLLSMSKSATISVLLAVILGSWVHRHGLISVIGGLLILVAMYGFVAGVVEAGRAHPDYDAEFNPPFTRLAILSDIVLGDRTEYEAADPGADDDSVIPKGLARLSAADVQGYLLNEYDRGIPGTSLDDFLAAAIPRVFWPDKPIITRYGAQLHERYWDVPDAESALAPTYSGEAYWNYGSAGVAVVSILLGLEFGWLTRRWHIAAKGLDPGYFVVALPVALWASYVETWVAASYIGGFLTLVILWLCARFVANQFHDGATAAIS